MMNIHIVEGLSLTPTQKARLERLGNVKYFSGVPDASELAKRCEGADIIGLDWAPIDAAIPKIEPGPRLISLPFTSVGWLPLKEAAEKGIKIANAPGYSTEAVAEFGVGLMISLVRNIHLYAKGEPKPEVTSTLYGKCLVILGAGRIGKAVGKSARSLGMKVVYWRRGASLTKTIARADVLYCALPLSEETEGLLGKKEFEALKKGCYFVTTSHNKIYDHAALLKALGNNLAGAAIDLEGINTGDYRSDAYLKLRANPKVLVTPHVAYKTDYSIKAGYDMMIDNIEAFIAGKPANIVN